ncbi:DnaJ domain [seawater metagenome]|uniref:DnaJ domain n=1 Tax=seawater metagenome TaxID=1561972 RepID=A0A5E8CH31_9ZZZZ
MPKDYYKILGISQSCDLYEIKKAYKKKALELHPDKNINNSSYDPQSFREISDAYQILSDDQNRRRYDSLLNMNGFDYITEEEFMNIFGNFKPPSDIFSDFFNNIPDEYQEVSNNIFNYFFEDKETFNEDLNNLEFKKIASQFKKKLFKVPQHIFGSNEAYYNIFYKMIKIVFSIFYFCSFYFFNQLQGKY